MSRTVAVPHYQAMGLVDLRIYLEHLENVLEDAHQREVEVRNLWKNRFGKLPESHHVDLFLDAEQLRAEREEWGEITQCVRREFWNVETRLWELEDAEAESEEASRS